MAQCDSRPRRRDFDIESRSVINLACKVYEALLASECAFPDAAAEAQFVRIAWDIACEEMSQDVEISSDVDAMVHQRSPSHVYTV